jgi:two-component system, chemotaxis family, CheB/CheR fusion protein
MNSSEASPEFEALLNYLKHHQGVDLTGYKRSTLVRRFQHRMHSLNIHHYQDYHQHLQSHPEEYLSLLDDVLINVTRFFRDSETWDYLKAEVIPTLLANQQADEPIRVWSAGCAAGHEICSVLMLLAETLGVEACLARVRCYATDIDELALKEARRGVYSDLDITEVPPNLIAKYFKHTEQGYVFAPDLHQTIVFGRQNLMRDPPISKIDLLICRNVLIYLNPEAQASILVRFHFALKNTGFLFLGRAETLLNRRPIFTPVNFKHRIYTKGLQLELQDYLHINPNAPHVPSTDVTTTTAHFWKAAFQTSPIAQFVIDREGCLIDMNEQALLRFRCTLDHYHQPFREIEPGKLVATHLANFYNNPQYITLKNIDWQTLERTLFFEITIAPVFTSNMELLGAVVSFLEQSA